MKILKVSVLAAVMATGVGTGLCDTPKPACKGAPATTTGKSSTTTKDTKSPPKTDTKTDAKPPAQKGGTAGKTPAPPPK